ncbi:hypothetical protein VFPPC_12915 [Pochonia chlamydosporia 170]|uniref:Uncharacterized protein n=1 Tax=Pochonia chlamydosporia 170 TaxID=1380566 RepID=A0A179G5E1_METCM|nr:hypothetical protein VFPPC_12915 [Pochonia chlamydosporia 170]OAQ73044.1 hypothetical protein VFPPC_12915 [Pochonia chlamydosporia 170]
MADVTTTANAAQPTVCDHWSGTLSCGDGKNKMMIDWHWDVFTSYAVALEQCKRTRRLALRLASTPSAHWHPLATHWGIHWVQQKQPDQIKWDQTRPEEGARMSQLRPDIHDAPNVQLVVMRCWRHGLEGTSRTLAGKLAHRTRPG